MQPDNEQIIKEISEAEQYLRALLERLLKLNATPRSLGDVIQALEIVNRSCASDSQCVGGSALRHGYAIASSPQLPESITEQITKAVKDALSSGTNS